MQVWQWMLIYLLIIIGEWFFPLIYSFLSQTLWYAIFVGMWQLVKVQGCEFLPFPRAFVLSEYEQSQLKYKLNFPILFSMLACCSTSHLQDCYIISCILINVSCLLFALFFVSFSFNHFTSSKLIKSKMQGGCWEWKKQGGQ